VTNEADWIRMARAGDQSAFGRLVTAYQTPVYNLCYRMLGNAAEGEEAAQETFLRAYTHLRSYDPQRPFRSWLLSIASHYCIDRLRRRRITWLPLEDEFVAPSGAVQPSGRASGQGIAAVQLASDSPSPESVVAQREREEHIRGLLASLSPTDRAAITLRYWYDYSYEEIAETLTLTISAVKSRLHRARRALAGMMEGETDNAL
jgi:RNA polymerase sigma-70 factor (ECF subfamily)